LLLLFEKRDNYRIERMIFFISLHKTMN